jgi:hypothetical protein
LEAFGPDKRRDFGHIGRIMEIELGKKMEGDEKCEHCKSLGKEY